MDRYIPSLYRQNERPVEPEKISAPISGTFENNIRPSYKDINELRPGNKPKETYEGRVLSGKLGENRGVFGEMKKNRPDTFFENNYRFSGPGEFVGPKVREDYSVNMKASSRQSYNMEYYGGQDSIHKATKQRLSNVDNTSDANKPVSTAQQAALDLKEALANKLPIPPSMSIQESTLVAPVQALTS